MVRVVAGMRLAIFVAFGGDTMAGVLMKHGLMHPDLYFDAWANPTRAWERVRIPVQGLRDQLRADELYANFEWLAAQGEQWQAARAAL